MDIKITTSEIEKSSLLSTLIRILFGIFLTSLIFAISLKLFQEKGIWLAIIFTIVLCFFGFYYTSKGSKLRPILYTILITLIIGAVAYFVGLNVLTDSLEGL